MTPLKSITKRVDNTEWRIEIDYDHFATNPRENYDNSFLCINDDRFVNELKFDFKQFNSVDMLTEEEATMMGGVYNDKRWKLIDQRVNEALEKEINKLAEEKKLKVFYIDIYEHSLISLSLLHRYNEDGFILTETEEDAGAQIKEYNSYINGECYLVTIDSREIVSNETGKEFFSEWENEDAMSFIGWESIRAPSQSPLSQEEWEKFINE